MTDEELLELEWAATYLTTHERREGCRCAGSCSECAEWATQEAKVGPAVVARLVAELRRARSTSGRARAIYESKLATDPGPK